MGWYGSLWRDLHSDPYVQDATMCSWSGADGDSRGAARLVAGSVSEDLDIVSAAECTGGPTFGDRHEQRSSFSPPRRRLACLRANRAVRRCVQAVPDRAPVRGEHCRQLLGRHHAFRARWARSRRLRLHRIDEASIAAFLDEHLPGCCCPGPTRHDRVTTARRWGICSPCFGRRAPIAAPTQQLRRR